MAWHVRLGSGYVVRMLGHHAVNQLREKTNAIVQTFLPHLIALYRAGKLPIERLVQHYPHTAINDAVADMLGGKTIKAVLQIDTTAP